MNSERSRSGAATRAWILPALLPISLTLPYSLVSGGEAGERAWIDVDGDGALDLFVANPDGPERLFVRRDGALVDMTEPYGLGGFELLLAAWEDFDRDGDLDLFALRAGGSALYENDGARFVEVTQSAGLAHTGLDLDAAWSDADGDGWADLEIAQEGRRLLYANLGDATFDATEIVLPVSAPSGAALSAPGSSTAAPARTSAGTSRVHAPSASHWDSTRGASSSSAVGAGGAVAPAGPQPTPQSVLACALSVVDAATGMCVGVSTEPVEGSLYPLSSDFFVAPKGDIGIGTTSPAARLHVTEVNSTGPQAIISGGAGPVQLLLEADDNNGGGEDQHPTIRMTQDGGGVVGILGFQDGSNDFSMENEFGGTSLVIGSDSAVRVFDNDLGVEAFRLRPNVHGGGQFVGSDTAGEPMTALDTSTTGGGGRLRLWDGENSSPAVLLESQEGPGGANLEMRASSGIVTFYVDSEFNSGGGCRMEIRDSSGDDKIAFQGETGGVRVATLQVTGGSDIAEPFHIEGAEVLPGMLVAIDPERAGGLRVASDAYERGIVGIVSGAAGIRPGLTLTQEGTIADGEHPVALSGRVWCLAETSNGAIAPGDLLTSSGLAGHAMRADCDSKSFGAVVGKAMTGLDSETGLVLVWVNLQ